MHSIFSTWAIAWQLNCQCRSNAHIEQQASYQSSSLTMPCIHLLDISLQRWGERGSKELGKRGKLSKEKEGYWERERKGCSMTEGVFRGDREEYPRNCLWLAHSTGHKQNSQNRGNLCMLQNTEILAITSLALRVAGALFPCQILFLGISTCRVNHDKSLHSCS